MSKKALLEFNLQKREPFLEALEQYVLSKPVPFDVPGHKMGGFDNDLEEFVGKRTYECDINGPYGMDNLVKPSGVIKEAEDLCAKAFKADGCLFSVNGTTGGILTEILGVLRAKDKIILPRNVHKSVINALILSGAVPIFVKPDIDPLTGISNGVPVEEYAKAIEQNPDAKVVFAINPTYFGLVSDLKAIAALAHKHGMIAMADEAHGTHFYFSDRLPLGALQAGFDITTASMHKTGGSLTQSSLVMYKGKRVDWDRVKAVFSMMMSTSPNSLLMASIDAARKRMFFDGDALLGSTIAKCLRARKELSQIPGLSVIDHSYIDGKGRFGIDDTKLVVDVSGLGITGFDAYHELKMRSNVQLELGEFRCCLAIFGVGTTDEQTNTLISAFKELSENHYSKRMVHRMPHFNFTYPELVVRPRVAFNAPHRVVPSKDAAGEISAESVMIYPPGIPLLIPGERITVEALKELSFYKKHGGIILSDTKVGEISIVDRTKWYRASDLDSEF